MGEPHPAARVDVFSRCTCCDDPFMLSLAVSV
jgi:hypothetical protein